MYMPAISERSPTGMKVSRLETARHRNYLQIALQQFMRSSLTAQVCSRGAAFKGATKILDRGFGQGLMGKLWAQVSLPPRSHVSLVALRAL